MTQTDPRPPEEALWRRMLYALGVVWLLLTGLCTAAFVGLAFSDLGSVAVGTLLFALVGGFICMAPGLVMVRVAKDR